MMNHLFIYKSPLWLRSIVKALILYGITLSLPAYSQAIVAYSLKEAQDYAIKNSLALRSDAQNVENARAKVKELFSTGMPKLGAGAEATFNIIQPTSLIQSGTFGSFPGPGEIIGFVNQDNNLPVYIPGTPDTTSSDKPLAAKFGQNTNLNLKLEASQLIFNPSYTIGLRAARGYVELAQKQSELKESDIRANVAKAYCGVLVAQENLAILRKNLLNLEKIKNEMSEIYKAGFIEAIDVDRITLSIETLKIQEQNVQDQKNLTEYLLKFQMNYPLDTPIALTDKLNTITAALSADIPDEVDPSKRREIQVLEIQEKLNNLDLTRLKKAGLPTVAAFGTLNYGYQGNYFKNFFRQWYPAAILGISANLTLFDGGYQKSLIAQKKTYVEQLKIGREQLTQSFDLQLQQNKTMLETARNQVISVEKNLALAQKIYDLSLEKYKGGVGSSLELAQAESKLFEVQAQYINAIFNLVNARLDIEKTLGNY